MITVADILREKGTMVHSASTDEPLSDAIARMLEHEISALLVVDHGRGAGMLTERDCLHCLADSGCDATVKTVAEAMTWQLVTVSPSSTLDDCMALMTHRRIRHLPVVEDHRLCGIVSIGDLVKYQLDDQRRDLTFLLEYIHGEFIAWHPRHRA